MQAKITNAVNMPIQSSSGNGGRKNEAADKSSFSNCLVEKQQQSGQDEKATTKQGSDAERNQPATGATKNVSQDKKADGKDKTMPEAKESTSQPEQDASSLAQTDQPVVQKDMTADLTLRMIAFAPVTVPPTVGNVSVVQCGSAANSRATSVNNASTLTENASLAQGLNELIGIANAMTATANLDDKTATVLEAGNTPILTAESLQKPALTVAQSAVGTMAATAVSSETDSVQSVGDAVATEPIAAALTQTTSQIQPQTGQIPVQQVVATDIQQTEDVAGQQQQATMQATPVAAPQKEQQSVVTSAAAAVMSKPETKAASKLQDADQTQDKQQQDAPTQIGQTVAATAGQTQTQSKSGKFTDQGQSEDNAQKADSLKGETAETNPLDFSSVRSKVDVVSHSGVTKTNQAVVKTDDVLRQVADQVRLVRRPGTEQMIMHLKPEQLGDVTVKLLLEGGKLTATFHADNPEVRAVLENSLQQLKQELTSVGIKVHDVGVYTGLGNPLSQGGGQGQAWAGMTGGNSDGRKTVTLSEAAIEEMEQQNVLSASASSESGVDYRV